VTYDEATRHATWDESLVWALAESLRYLKWQTSHIVRLRAEAQRQALSREITLADRDPYEFRLVSYPWGSLPSPRGRVVNRRQFLGATLAGTVAALSLPFERFAEWCREWLGAKREELISGVYSAHFEIGDRIQTYRGGHGSGFGVITAVDRLRGTITVSA
jgi:hypothetical protein